MFGANDSIYSPLWHNGPRPGAFYNFPGAPSTSGSDAGFKRIS